MSDEILNNSFQNKVAFFFRKNFKKIIIFLGKRGEEDLLQASKNWDIKYKQRMSITSDDSFIIEINKLEKKN